MNHIRAIGFDLFNTLITVRPDALDVALARLAKSLDGNDLTVDEESFKLDHRRAAVQFIEDTRSDGRETHNRFWISAALAEQGYHVPPDDARIAAAVEAYFSAFLDFSSLIPGTKEMLSNLREKYPLGLLSNFTHAPAARRIVIHLGLDPFFRVILISGELGYRKPHSSVFQGLCAALGYNPDETAYVGDDPEPDVAGALHAGLQPIWMTYVRDRMIPFAPGIASEQMDEIVEQVPRVSSWEELIALLNGT